MRRIANKTTRVSTIPSTPKRRKAFDRLKDAIRISKKKHPVMLNYKYKLKKQETRIAQEVRDHKEINQTFP